MTDISVPTLSNDQLELKGASNTYLYAVTTGRIIGDVSIHPTQVGFFLKTDDGKEHDITLNTSMKAREGHIVSVIYASKSGADTEYAVGWINHTTTKADFFNDAALKVVGDKVLTFFSAMAEAGMNTTANLMEGNSGCINFIILPVTLSFVLLSLAFLSIAILFGMGSYKQAKGILSKAHDIARDLEPSLPSKKKPSLFLRILKWIGLGFVGLIILSLFAR